MKTITFFLLTIYYLVSTCTVHGQILAQPSNFEDVPIYRLQISYLTANVSDGGTDDNVFVQFNSQMQPFYLDLAKDDRERNKTDLYDVVDDNIKTIRDLDNLIITKSGTDGWAMQSISIIVNGYPIFQKTLSNRWIDGNDGNSPTLTYNRQQLRADNLWRYNNRLVHVPALMIPSRDLKNMIESLVGNQIRYIQSSHTVKWGSTGGKNTLWGDAVETKYIAADRLRVDLDLQVAVAHLPNPELDVDFDIVVRCEGNRVSMKFENFHAQVNFFSLVRLRRIEKNLLKNLNRSFNNVTICNVHFEQNGSLKFL